MSVRISFITIAIIFAAWAAPADLHAQADARPAASQAPLTLTLQDALARAKSNSVQFQAALTEQGLAHQDQVQARAALLPSVTYNNQFIYTEPNGLPSGVFIANNSVHEYASQANVRQVIGYGTYSDLDRKSTRLNSSH